MKSLLCPRRSEFALQPSPQLSLLSDMAYDAGTLGCPDTSQVWLRVACGLRGCTQRHKQRVSPSKVVSSENPVVVIKQKCLIPAVPSPL